MTASASAPLRRAAAWLRALPLALLAAAVMGGCGGDVGTGGTGVAPASYASGRISGFGSVIVNGVRYDDSAAAILDADGHAQSADALQLGMTVSIEAGAVTTDATGAQHAVATSVRYAEDLSGPVGAVDVAAGTLAVMGQAVDVDAATVFDGYTAGLSSVQTGDLVRVYAFLDDGAGTYHATRIEKVASLSAYVVEGVVSGLDAAMHQFSIGALAVDAGGVAGLPSLSNGLRVRAELATTPVGTTWTATAVTVLAPHELSQDEHTEVEGIVSGYQGLSDFLVDGVPVDASGSGVTFDGGTAADLADGVRVEINGDNQGGVVKATAVSIRKSDSQEADVELHGQITAADAASQTFTLRGQTVHWSASTTFGAGSAADLKVGASLQVHGTLADAGTRVEATEIEFDH